MRGGVDQPDTLVRGVDDGAIARFTLVQRHLSPLSIVYVGQTTHPLEQRAILSKDGHATGTHPAVPAVGRLKSEFRLDRFGLTALCLHLTSKPPKVVRMNEV